VHLQDGLLYIEPPDWYYPIRESLGAAFLRAGDPKGAERTFRDDLTRNPRNARSLFGLAEALKALKPEDWTEIASAVTGHKDPLFSDVIEERFDALRAHILRLEQEAEAERR